MRALLLLLLATVTLRGQGLTLTALGSPPATVEATYDYGRTTTAEPKEITFRLTNSNPNLVVLQPFEVTGVGFRLVNAPAVGHRLPPATSVEFGIRFQVNAPGTYNATLRMNTRAVLLIARADGAAETWLRRAGTAIPLAAGTSIDFGELIPNQTTTVELGLANPFSTELRTTVGLQSDAFRTATGEVTLAPGETRWLPITATGATTRELRGQLTVDHRVFALAARLRIPLLTLAPPAGDVRSAQQLSLRLTLSEPAPIRLTGRLRLEFNPAGTLSANDPGLLLLNSGQRQVEFSYAPGATTPIGADGRELRLQTGTTAGTIRLTADFEGRSQTITVPLAPVAPAVTGVTASREPGKLVVTTAGWDNQQTTGSLSFTFYDRNGRALGQPLIVEAEPAFSAHFRNGGVAGLFQVRAEFPVTGDATQIGGVEVGVANALGIGRSERVQF